MRIYLKTTKSTEKVLYDNYQNLLTGVLHKWIGKNNEHGNISLYSFSRLEGGNHIGRGVIYPEGANWFISAWDNKLIEKIVHGIKAAPVMFNGLRVNEIILQENPDLSTKNHFLTASPVLLKEFKNGKTTHYTYSDSYSTDLLKKALLTKMESVGLALDNSLEIKFDTEYPKPKTKLIKYKTINNKCSVCPVIINAQPQTKLFAWNVGIGNSTGIGLGAIK